MLLDDFFLFGFFWFIDMRMIKDLGIIETNGRGRRFGLFYCPKCGFLAEKIKEKGVNAKTCGCGKHYMHKTNIYRRWQYMKTRCSNPKHKGYHNYGGRGIKVCFEWMKFENFRDWAMKNGYKKELQIDRIDNDGDYEPSNCRFVDNKTNSRNSRNSKMNEESVRRLRRLNKTGMYSRVFLSKIFKISEGSVGDIINRKTWDDI